MEALKASTFVPSPHIPATPARLQKPQFLHFQFSSFVQSNDKNKSRSKIFTNLSSSSTVSAEPLDPTELELEADSRGEKFDWYAQWYPVMPVCDLDKRVPHAKKVMGLDVVVWWDKNESSWKVFNDACPHRLAPLSEGRIDQWGRLQCVYHGWCFSGSGDCKFIPQAPPDDPPVHTSKNACVAAYPSTLQNEIVWFWPNASPEYKDILSTKKPPYIAELDDPSFTKIWGNREFPFEYEILIENLVDPAHIPYAHYKLLSGPPSHVVNCSGCSLAYKSLNALEVVLQVISIGSIGIVAATKQNAMSAAVRTSVVLMAILCFTASRWLAHFIYKNFHFHDYNHALL